MASRWFLLLLLLTGHSLLAQPFASRNLSLQQGLPEFYVSGIVQDKADFIWIATRDGLARYDGRSFKIFRHQPRTKHSIASNVITSLRLISDSTILIQLENVGFQWFNPITGQFSDLLTKKRLDRYHTGVDQATLTPDGRQLWGRKETRITHYDPQRDQLIVYPFPHLPPSKEPFAGNAFLLGSQSLLYAPVPGGLLALNTRTGQWRQWVHPAIGHQGLTPTFYSTPIIKRANGELLISAIRQLIAFNPRTHRFRSISIPSSIDTRAGVIHAAHDGNVYFTHAMTVYRLTPDDHVTALWTAPRIDYQNYFHALLLDRSGVLWVGTNGDGVQLIDLRTLPVRTYPYHRNFLADVLSLELGIQAPDWAGLYGMAYRVRFGGSANFMTTWFEDSYQLLRCDPNRRILRPLVSMPKSLFIHGEGNGLRVLANGQIWMYNPIRGLLKVDTSGRLLDVFACPNDLVSDIQPLGDWIWIGTEANGLYAYDLRTRRMVRHLRYQATDSTSLNSDHVWCLAADPHDAALLWVGTQEGLCQLDTRTMRFRTWTEKQGLPNATINTLLTDRRGRLWFSTLKGISRIDPQTGQMRHFTTDDGLPDIEYKRYHGLELPGGRFAFGGLQGLTVFDPLALDETPQPVPTALTSLKINNAPVEPGQPGSPLINPLNATPTLELTHNQNFLSVEFAGLQYNKPTILQYRHQLRGVDADWVYTGNQNVATYTQLAPGDYEFRVNAADAGGHWSRFIKTIRVVIAPPWWATWWAYVLYALAIGGLAWYGIRLYLNRLKLQQTADLQQKEAQQLRLIDEMKSRFFANITHEFRTPLTLILTPAQRLKSTLDQPEQHRWVAAIERNAYQLLRLINQLMDLSKLDAQALKVDESRGHLSDFIAQVVQPFDEAAEAKGIGLTYRSEVQGDYWFDAGKLERIVTNLIANALKFTPGGGQINSALRYADGIILTVADTGMGIAPEKLPHIFDRFYQADDSATRQQEGTGIGLALVKELVDLQQGRIGVESKPGMGTVFTVFLPYRPVTEPVPVPSLPSATANNGKPPAHEETTPDEQPSILVVEDNDELAEFIAESLPRHYRISRAANGAEGLAQSLDRIPDLVISDVLMPVMDGYTFCQELKQDERTSHIPLILLTAKAALDSRIEGLSKGADDYLTKPFHIQELQLRVHNLLERQRRMRQWVRTALASPTALSPETSPAPTDPFLGKLYCIIESHLDDSTFGVEELADEVAMSRMSLHRKTKALTDLPLNELIRNYRLKQATNYLRQGHTVAETADLVGFGHPSYFTKCFRELYQVTPTEFAARQE